MSQASGNHSSDSLYSLTLRALLWQGGGQVGERLARVLTNVVLTRLLLPADFGVAGAVTAALASVDSIMFIGSNQAILQSDRGRRPEFLDTAFWVGMVRGVLIGLAVLALAPLISRYFASAEATPMFALLAVQPVVCGLANPRVQLLVKDLQFRTWSIYQVLTNILGLLVTILLAWELRNAWALVLGQLVTQMAVTAGSYLIMPYRPRRAFDRDSWRELKTFGLRASGMPLILMLIAQAPVILLGRMQGMTVLGIFLLNQRLAAMPQNLFTRAVSTVALPAYSAIKNDAHHLAAVWLKALRLIGLLILPAGVVLMWIDNALPAVLYGSQFAAARGLFSLLVLEAVLCSVGVVTEPLFWAVGLPSYDRNIQLVRMGALYAAGGLLAFYHDIFGLAVGLAGSAALSQVLVLIYARAMLGIRWRSIAGALAPGSVLAVLVSGLLVWLERFVPLTPARTLVLGGVVLTLAVVAAVRHCRGRMQVRVEPLPVSGSVMAGES
jgi:lipopolysaccharide exporter